MSVFSIYIGKDDGKEGEFMSINKPQIKLPPIDMELVGIRRILPNKLAQLSNYDKKAAVSILQDWGFGKKPLRKLFDDVNNELEKHER